MYIVDIQLHTFFLTIFFCNKLKIKSMELCKILSGFFSAIFFKALQTENRKQVKK